MTHDFLLVENNFHHYVARPAKLMIFLQIAVQACHACLEAGKSFHSNWIEPPHLVLCGVKTEESLYRCLDQLEEVGIRCQSFREPDRNDELTAIATEPVSGEQRRFFKKYRLLGEAGLVPVAQ